MGSFAYEKARTLRRRAYRQTIRNRLGSLCANKCTVKMEIVQRRVARYGSRYKNQKVYVSYLEGHHFARYSLTDPFHYIGHAKQLPAWNSESADARACEFPESKLKLLCRTCHQKEHGY
jgi:hypothetical protein